MGGLAEMLVALLRQLRWDAALSSDDDDTACVACGSRELEVLGERAYACMACGYEGGSGLVEMQEAARRRAWDAWSPDRRLRSAQSDLVEAERLVLSASGALQGARSSALLDVVGLAGAGGGLDGPDETQSALVVGLGQLDEARRLLDDAGAKAGGLTGERADGGIVDTVAWSAEIYLDHPVTDLMMIRHVADAQQAAEALAAAVERARGRLEPRTPGATGLPAWSQS